MLGERPNINQSPEAGAPDKRRSCACWGGGTAHRNNSMEQAAGVIRVPSCRTHRACYSLPRTHVLGYDCAALRAVRERTSKLHAATSKQNPHPSKNRFGGTPDGRQWVCRLGRLGAECAGLGQDTEAATAVDAIGLEAGTHPTLGGWRGAVKKNRCSQVTKGRVLPKMDMYLRNRRDERILLRAWPVRARVEIKRFVGRSCTPVSATDGPLEGQRGAWKLPPQFPWSGKQEKKARKDRSRHRSKPRNRLKTKD